MHVHAHLDVVHVQQPHAPQRPQRRRHRARAAPRAHQRHTARRAEEWAGAALLAAALGRVIVRVIVGVLRGAAAHLARVEAETRVARGRLALAARLDEGGGAERHFAAQEAWQVEHVRGGALVQPRVQPLHVVRLAVDVARRDEGPLCPHARAPEARQHERAVEGEREREGRLEVQTPSAVYIGGATCLGGRSAGPPPQSVSCEILCVCWFLLEGVALQDDLLLPSLSAYLLVARAMLEPPFAVERAAQLALTRRTGTWCGGARRRGGRARRRDRCTGTSCRC